MKKRIAVVTSGVALVVSGVSLLGALLFSDPVGDPNTAFTTVASSVETPYIKYAAGTGLFTLRSDPTRTTFAPGFSGLMPATDERMIISIVVDGTGAVVGGDPGPDFILTGTVTDPQTSITYTGTTAANPLLTGEILAMGFLDGGTAGSVVFPDLFDFRFRVTGGALADLYTGKDLGVQVINDKDNDFVSFAAAFHGGEVKGNLGPVPRPPGECTGTLGDYVWHDANHNGIQDGFEHGIEGVTLTLTPTAPPGPVQTTTTDANGYYQFSGLCRGDYTVQATNPVGYSPTITGAGTPATDSNSNPTFVSYPVDNFNDQTIDFGYVTPCAASIGDFVWLDVNGNGIQDDGDTGRNGVTVQLLDSADNVLATQTTHNHPVTGKPGYYTFDGLCFGDYKVKVVPPGGGETFTLQDQGVDDALDSDVDQTTGVTGVYHLDDGTDNPTVDIGLVPPCDGAIGDFVWNDANHNGIQDPGEAGINGVVVTLANSGGPIQTFTTTTHSGQPGWYQFTGLCADSYTVSVPLPSGYTNFSPTKVTDPPVPGATIANDSDGTPTVDQTASVASVTLTFGHMDDQTIDFGFYIVVPGIAIVKYTNGADANDPNGAGVPNIGPGGVVTWTYKVTNTGETTVAAADVHVTDSQPGVTPVFDSVLTGDADGLFEPGEVWLYTATGTALNLVLPAPPGVTTVPNSCTAGGTKPPRTAYTNVGTATIPGATASDPSSYCNPEPASLGDYAFVDANSTGLQDAGDSPLGGVVVTLLDCGGQPGKDFVGAVVPAQTTGSDGKYLFTNLLPGACYKVSFSLPGGYTRTTANAGADNIDSDADASTGVTSQTYILAPGEQNLTVDAGYVPIPVCIPTSSSLKSSSSSSTSGPYGNYRLFNGNTIRATAWGRNRSTGAWATAYLGAYTYGLGVTDRSESGANNTHIVDNGGGYDNYVVFEFKSPVTVGQVELNYIQGDSDVTIWIGSKADAFTATQVLSDAYLTALGFTEVNDSSVSSGSRLADINSGGKSGNILVVAAKTGTDTADGFKISKLVLECPTGPAPLGLSCPASTGQAGVPYSSALLASGGVSPYAFSVAAGALPTGLTLNPSTGAITGTPATAGTFAFTGKVDDSDGSTATTATAACTIRVAPPKSLCVAGTYSFTGSAPVSGTAGNIRTYSLGSGGLSVHVSAFSSTKTATPAYYAGYLGAYSLGLGVTDHSESGTNDTHVVDNAGENNYVLFEFNAPVVVDKAYLAYVLADSDIDMWVGSATDPYTNHKFVNASFLGSLPTRETNYAADGNDRWADLNAGGAAGNVLVVAAKLGDSLDGFKLQKLTIGCK